MHQADRQNGVPWGLQKSSHRKVVFLGIENTGLTDGCIWKMEEVLVAGDNKETIFQDSRKIESPFSFFKIEKFEL